MGNTPPAAMVMAPSNLLSSSSLCTASWIELDALLAVPCRVARQLQHLRKKQTTDYRVIRHEHGEEDSVNIDTDSRKGGGMGNGDGSSVLPWRRGTRGWRRGRRECHTLGVLAGLEVAREAANGELQAGFGRPRHGLGALGLALAATGGTHPRLASSPSSLLRLGCKV